LFAPFAFPSLLQVSTSRYWFNYRHNSNALAVYHTVRALGIPDSNILLMLPDSYACNPRNVEPAQGFVQVEEHRRENLAGEGIEVDYRGSEVTVPTFMRLLTGRHESAGTPRSKRLLSDADSNVLIYLTGHGGNNFLKFQDNEELNAQDVRDALQQMWVQKRYKSMLFMLDTCQAGTLFRELNSEDTPNVVTIGSSQLGQSSYSYQNDMALGVSLADRFTYFTLEFFERNGMGAQGSTLMKKSKKGSGAARPAGKGQGLQSKKTLLDLFSTYSFAMLNSEVEVRTDLLSPSIVAPSSLVLPQRSAQHGSIPRDWLKLAALPLTDFFGAVTHVQATNRAYQLREASTAEEQHQLAETYLSHEESGQHSSPNVTAQTAAVTSFLVLLRSPLPVAFSATREFWILLIGGAAVLLVSSLALDGAAVGKSQSKPVDHE
jgi:phosphatidylinositol glycan class K